MGKTIKKLPTQVNIGLKLSAKGREHIVELPEVKVAQSFLSRFKGLLGTKSAGNGILFVPGGQIHMIGMRYPLCVLYINEKGCIIDLELAPPGKLGKKVAGVKYVLELDAEYFEKYHHDLLYARFVIDGREDYFN